MNSHNPFKAQKQTKGNNIEFSPSSRESKLEYGKQAYSSQYQPIYEPLQCDCLDKLRLKVEGELDKLRGEFRKKEQELIAPLLNKYS